MAKTKKREYGCKKIKMNNFLETKLEWKWKQKSVTINLFVCCASCFLLALFLKLTFIITSARW